MNSIRWDIQDDSRAYFADVTPYVTLVVTPDGREWSVECHPSRVGQARWVTIYCEDGKVCCCGWPESWANESDCELVRKATDEQRKGLLIQLAASQVEDSRRSYARHRLAVTEAPHDN